MTIPDNDSWTDLRNTWEHGASDAALDLAATTRRIRAWRHMAMARALITIAAIVGIGAAVVHAANVIESILALGVALAILAMWARSSFAGRREAEMLMQPSETYVPARQTELTARIRSATYVWIVMALLLVFFVPWWLGGFGVHRRELTSALALLALWLPMAAVGVLAWWSRRSVARARAELAALTRVTTSARES